jgi:hypothetical protein
MMPQRGLLKFMTYNQGKMWFTSQNAVWV